MKILGRNHRARRRASLLITLSTMVVMLPLLAAPGQADTGSDRLFEQVGSLPRIAPDALAALGPDYVDPKKDDFQFAASGMMIMLPEARQLWQFYQYRNPKTRLLTTPVIVRDLDTLSIKAVVQLERPATATNGETGDWLYAVDGNRRLFLYSNTVAKYVDVVDLQTFTTRRLPIPENLHPAYTGIGGMGYDPHSDSLLMIYSGPVNTLNANSQTFLLRMSLANGAVTGPRRVAVCTGGLTNTDTGGNTYASPVYVADDKDVFLHCDRAGRVSTVVRIPRAQVMDPSSPEDFVTGPVNAATRLVDPGGRRMIVGTDTGQLWVFDTQSMAFVGVVAAHPDDGKGNVDVGYGVDEESGRLFYLAPAYGLGVAEGRSFPLPQARNDSSFAAAGRYRLYSDARTGRLFARARGSGTGYDIYRVAPAPPAPPSPDPDSTTIDAPETPGVTESSFAASASGYGTRALMSNGVVPLIPFPFAGALNPGADLFAKNLTSPCWFSDRDMFVGRVAKTEADTGSTAASAIAADIDARSKQDLERPSRCDPSVKDNDGGTRIQSVFGTVPGAVGVLDGQVGPAIRWNRDPAVCTSSSGDEPKAAAPNDNGSPPLGTSGVECAVPDGKRAVKASAQGSLSGPVSVGRSASWTEIRREARGIVTTARAVASDIELGGLVRIAEVSSTAVSVSNGRPGTQPLSQHIATIKGLSIGDQVVCAGTCDGAQAAAALNTIAAGRVQFRVGLGAADAGLLKGTPKGALTAVQKSPQRQVSDQALAGDSTFEVPALEMVVYNDNFSWGRARQVYQFAGVATGANYNVVRLPQGSPLAPSVDTGSLPGTSLPGMTIPGTPGTSGTGDIPGTEGTAGTEGDDSLAGGTAGTPGTPGSSRSLPVGAALAGAAGQVADAVGDVLGAIGGAVGGAVAALGRGLRFVLSDWRQALLLFTAWLLLAQPLLLARRRRLLLRVQSL